MTVTLDNINKINSYLLSKKDPQCSIKYLSLWVVQRLEILKIKLSTMRIGDILYKSKHQTDKGSKIKRNQLGKLKLTAEQFMCVLIGYCLYV